MGILRQKTEKLEKWKVTATHTTAAVAGTEAEIHSIQEQLAELD